MKIYKYGLLISGNAPWFRAHCLRPTNYPLSTHFFSVLKAPENIDPNGSGVIFCLAHLCCEPRSPSTMSPLPETQPSNSFCYNIVRNATFTNKYLVDSINRFSPKHTKHTCRYHDKNTVNKHRRQLSWELKASFKMNIVRGKSLPKLLKSNSDWLYSSRRVVF